MNIAFERNKTAASFGITLILLLLILIYLKPLLNTWDDAFIMYSFSGGFGVPSTELVDYSWGWHFLLGLTVKNLFIFIPYINWYSVILLFIHWLSSSLILIFFLNTFRLPNALLCFAIFFLVFETTLLLSLNFTSTSIISAIAANVILIEKINHKKFKKAALIIPFALLVVSGLLRFHAWALIELIFGLFIFFLPREKAVIYIAFKSGLLGLIVLLFVYHQSYYKQHVPEWEQKENVSQVLYSYYNAPRMGKQYREVFRDSIEWDFFYNNFYYDTLILSNQRLKEITGGLTRVRNFSSVDKETVYWIFINGRLYFFILALPLSVLIAKRKWYLIRKIFPFLFGSLILYCYLFFFKKITEPIFMGFLISNWFVVFLFLTREEIVFSRLSRIMSVPLIIICFLWAVIRVSKINSGNIEKYGDWICYYEDLNRNASKIHVATNPENPIDYFSIIDNPIDFTIRNFISVSQFNATVYEAKKQEFGLKKITEDLINRPNIVLIGSGIPSLKTYYLKKYNRDVEIVTDTVHYNCANVYQIVSR
ncbi:MAG TPA: hypothetical protein VLC28_02675 [Flavitalea sp.]|nr:hypothetical protein [Flavitalea sp.]